MVNARSGDPVNGWPDRFEAVAPTACFEAIALAALAAHVVLTQTTVTSHWRRVAGSTEGLLLLGAVTGAAIAHLWIDNERQ